MDTINGLPAHPLFVHLAVVAIPTAALLGILSVLWPAARERLGIITPIVAVVAMVITPLTTSAGEALEKTSGTNPSLAEHVELGDQMIGWVAALFVAVVLFWALHFAPIIDRVGDRLTPTVRRIASLVLGLAVVVVGIGAIVMTILVGDYGAQSVWQR